MSKKDPRAHSSAIVDGVTRAPSRAMLANVDAAAQPTDKQTAVHGAQQVACENFQAQFKHASAVRENRRGIVTPAGLREVPA